MNIDHACRIVLMSAYLYYQRNNPVLSDSDNDSFVKLVCENWEKVPQRYLPLLDPDGIGRESIASTTYRCRYTQMVEGGALAWLKKVKNISLERLGHGYFEGGIPVGSVEDLLG